jgi:hypothetical protein
MTASTADNADAADPGVNGGTVEVEPPLADCPTLGVVLLLTLSETNVSVDPCQDKVEF